MRQRVNLVVALIAEGIHTTKAEATIAPRAMIMSRKQTLHVYMANVRKSQAAPVECPVQVRQGLLGSIVGLS